MVILGSADFVGYVTTLEMKKLVIPITLLFLLFWSISVTYLLFFLAGNVSRVIEVPRITGLTNCVWGKSNSYNTSVGQWGFKSKSSSTIMVTVKWVQRQYNVSYGFGNAKRNEASNVACKRPWLAIIFTQFVFLPEHSANHKFMCCLIVKIKSREHKWHYRMYSIDSKVGTVKVYTVTDKYSNSGKLQINLEAKCAVAVQVKDVLSLMRTKQSGAGNEDEQ